MCVSYIFPLILYWFLVLPFSDGHLKVTKHLLFSLLWGEGREVCITEPGNATLGIHLKVAFPKSQVDRGFFVGKVC